MNPASMQLKDMQDTAPDDGFVVLPDELQPAAESRVGWAKKQTPAAPTSTASSRAKRKRERQNRKAGRARR